jgi:hypothetical protein
MVVIKVEKCKFQDKHLEKIICLKLVIHLVIMEL